MTVKLSLDASRRARAMTVKLSLDDVETLVR
jgi:hypothetical protein